MVQISIPEDLAGDIGKLTPPLMSLDAYVTEILRDKLSAEARKREFYQLSDQTREAMAKQRISEAEILQDFEPRS